MSEESPLDRLRENATEVASILVTGLWLGGLFTGQGWWLPALLIGYIVVVPLVALLFGDEKDRAEWLDWEETESDAETTEGRSGDTDHRSDEQREESALAALRRRYAEGELTEEQFERKLERLLETETIEDVEDRYRRERDDRATEREYR